MKINRKIILSLLILFCLNTSYLKSFEYRNYIPSFETVVTWTAGYLILDQIMFPQIDLLMLKYSHRGPALIAYARLLKRYGPEKLKEWGIKEPN